MKHGRKALDIGVVQRFGDMSLVEEELFAAYLASMPPDYRRAFDLDAARAHEAIVRRRKDRSTHIEIWRELPERIVAVCVVADDRPGLLSVISAALFEEQIDVVSANAYCRTCPDGDVEAIDLLWLRRLPSSGSSRPIRAKDILLLAKTIERAVGDAVIRRKLGVLDGSDATSTEPLPANASARIRFDTDSKDGSTILTVEAVDRPGLLLAVTQALFRAGLQIIALRATTERGSAIDRFHLAEVDGKPLRRERLLTLQTAILGAIEEGTIDPRRRATTA